MVDDSIRWSKFVLGVFLACLMIGLTSISVFSVPQQAHAATLSVSEIEKQSASLYESLHHQKRSQAEIDAALQRQFGLQRVNTPTMALPLTSTNSDVNLPTTTIYRSRGTIFLYSNFSWNCDSGASCSDDPMDYNDVFGVWFSQNLPVNSTGLSVTDITGNLEYYQNPTNFSQAGADYSENANYWVSGVLDLTLKGDIPDGCTQIFTKYTHGWTSDEPTSVTVSAGFPPSFGVQVTYSEVSHSWQATGPSSAFLFGPGASPPTC